MHALKSLVVTGAVLGALTNVSLAESYKITHPYPATHYLWVDGFKVFTDEVASISGGNITFDVFPAGQLGKDYMTLLQSGIADIALIATSTFSTEKFPLTSVTELPGLYASSCEGTHKFWNLAQPGGELDKVEYSKENLHILFVSVLVPYSIMTTSKPVLKVEDLAGMKIRGNGAAQEKILSDLGAVPIKIGSTELYDALSRGTVDGALYPFSGVPPYDMQNVLHHAALGPQLGAGATVFTMTKSKWDSLPEETQKTFEQAAAKAQEHLCQWLDNTDAEIQKDISEKSGFTLNRLPDEEVQRWHDKVSGVTESWTKQMDGRGLQGSAVIEAFKAAK